MIVSTPVFASRLVSLCHITILIGLKMISQIDEKKFLLDYVLYPMPPV